jgi:hypothetical protein
MASCDDKEGYEGCVTLKLCGDELLLTMYLDARKRAVGNCLRDSFETHERIPTRLLRHRDT